MFTKKDNKLANKISLITRYFEGTDVTNSLLLKELPELPSDGEVLITSKRYDLLAKSIYGNEDYNWILQFYTGILEEELKLGEYLPYPSLENVKSLILSLDERNY